MPLTRKEQRIRKDARAISLHLVRHGNTMHRMEMEQEVFSGYIWEKKKRKGSR